MLCVYHFTLCEPKQTNKLPNKQTNKRITNKIIAQHYYFQMEKLTKINAIETIGFSFLISLRFEKRSSLRVRIVHVPSTCFAVHVRVLLVQ